MPIATRPSSRWLIALVGLTLGLFLPISSGSAREARYNGDLENTKPVKHTYFDAEFVLPELAPDRLTTIWVDDVLVVDDLDPAGELPDLRYPASAAVERLRVFFHDELVSALREKYPLTQQPGPGVARLQVTVTRLVPNRLPFDGATSLRAGNPTSRGVGAAAIQAELRDSVTGELLYAIADDRRGRPFVYNANRSFMWGDARRFFHRWALQIRYRLDDFHEAS